jgi:hypothetical protein
VLPEIASLSDLWLVLPIAAPSAIVGWLLLLRHRAHVELAVLDPVRRAFDEE